MALEPGGLKDQLVTAAADGEMKMIDFRMLGDASAAVPGTGATAGGGTGALGVWKTVNASATSRNLSALAAHPHSPLLATGTATQAWGPTSLHCGSMLMQTRPIAVCPGFSWYAQEPEHCLLLYMLACQALTAPA